MQIFEDGYLTDAKGTRVDFRNTIIIMTSNIGAHWLNKEAKLGFSINSGGGEKQQLEQAHEKNVQLILEDMKKQFKPEFLNRLDKIIVFKTLSTSSIRKIVNLQIQELSKRLQNKNIKINVSDSAKKFLIEKGYDSENGARPLRRVIQNLIEDPLANGILAGKFREGDTISIFKKGKEIKLFVLEAIS